MRFIWQINFVYSIYRYANQRRHLLFVECELFCSSHRMPLIKFINCVLISTKTDQRIIFTTHNLRWKIVRVTLYSTNSEFECKIVDPIITIYYLVESRVYTNTYPFFIYSTKFNCWIWSHTHLRHIHTHLHHSLCSLQLGQRKAIQFSFKFC